MADAKEFKITAAQGQFLLQVSASGNLQEKMGGVTYSPTDRAIVNSMIAKLFDELKAYSPYAQEYEPGKNVKLFFGPLDSWKQEKPDSPRWFMTDPKAILTVRLSKDAVLGAAWICYAVLVPREEKETQGLQTVSPSEAIETVWPILHTLGKSVSVGESLGLKKYDNKKHGWNDDPVPDSRPAVVGPIPDSPVPV